MKNLGLFFFDVGLTYRTFTVAGIYFVFIC